jgi:hypothetical protein
MDDARYAASKAFVKEMRVLASKRDLASIQQAVRRMQDWMQAYPDDVYVGTALEEFDILAEAARHVVESNNQSAPSETELAARAS